MIKGMTNDLLERRAADGRPSRFRTDRDLPDSNLLDDARKGSAAAFEQLFRDNLQRGVTKARGVVRDHATAEDIAAEAFTNVYAAIVNGFGPKETFRGYYLAAVHNTAVNCLRKASIRSEVTGIDVEAHSLAQLADAEVRGDDRAALVNTALASLPERWQTVLEFSHVDGGSLQQLAAMLGMSTSATAALTYRARKAFRTAYLELSAAQEPVVV